MRNSFFLPLTAICLFLGSCCQQVPQKFTTIDALPSVFPSDFGAAIPYNIAPLNFRVNDGCERLVVSYQGKMNAVEMSFEGCKTTIPVNKWSEFLIKNKGDSIFVTLMTCKNNKWVKYKPFSYFVSADPVDGYLIYRLIHPGYQTWNFMGIYQRSLTGFTVNTVLDSRIMPYTCMNCHSMASNNPDNMLLHLRENNAATILIRNGKAEKINTQTPQFKSVSFPSWHPSAKYIAFSINKVRQLFPATGHERAHGFDMESDMVIYNIDKKEYLMSPLLMSKDAFEAFPCFSPDGKTLYFISAPAKPMPDSSQFIRYSLCSIPFDADKGMLGNKADTLISARKLGRSVTMPKVSPLGNQIVVTVTDHGNFPAYFKDADLYSYNLLDSSLTKLDQLNSNDVESYHSWSSTGKWMVFSSRRMDGLYMNAYLAYFDENGQPHKPFLLPQEDADFHQTFLYSFNIPEFAIKPVGVTPYEIEEAARNTSERQVIFDTSH